MKLRNKRVKELSFGFVNIGIVGESSDEIFSDVSDTPIFLSGPLVNLVLGIVLFVAYLFSKNHILKIFFIQNFILAFVNLLPIDLLDGGKILKIILSEKLGFETAQKIVSILSVIFLIPISVLGFLILIRSKYNFSFLILTCYLISYIFLKT